MQHISEISLNAPLAENDASEFLQIRILFWFQHMRKTAQIPSLYYIRKDDKIKSPIKYHFNIFQKR